MYMRTSLVSAFTIVAMLGAVPAQAQFGGVIGGLGSLTKKKQADQTALTAQPDCGSPEDKKKKRNAIIGKVAVVAAGSAMGSAARANFAPLLEFANTLTSTIACKLDSTEQKQAATATDDVLKNDKVGQKVDWKSSSRKGVTGTTTITAEAPPPAGQSKARCMIVQDVVIVDGEETRADKKMCKAPGQSRYTIAQV
jgi:surface antigen